MITQKQIGEIREHLEAAQNPLFLYDNDVDGLCSFILLRRAFGRGRGVAIRSGPEIDKKYAKKAEEFKADYIFVLDRPFLGKEFLEEIKESHIPVIWIDHHDVEVSYDYKNIHAYNSIGKNDKSKVNEPVTYLSYLIGGRKEDIWIALVGCIADHYMPNFADEFAGKFPDFWGKDVKENEPFDVYYKTQIGLVARALGFGLKDSITHVIYMQNFLLKCVSPHDVLSEIESSSTFAKKYKEIKKKYSSLIDRAKSFKSDSSVLFFKYWGDLSISAELSNELSYLYPNKIIIVAYDKGNISNVSIRGENVRLVLQKIISRFDGASGGGHAKAVGARVRTGDLERFKNEFEKEIDKKNEK